MVSSMMAAKDLVSRCLPLVVGGNCVIFTRKSLDLCIAGDRSLQGQCFFWNLKLKHLLYISSNEVIRTFHSYSELFLVIVKQRSVGHNNERNLVPQRREDGTRA